MHRTLCAQTLQLLRVRHDISMRVEPPLEPVGAEYDSVKLLMTTDAVDAAAADSKRILPRQDAAPCNDFKHNIVILTCPECL